MKRWPVILLIALISVGRMVAQDAATNFTASTSDVSASAAASLIKETPLGRDDEVTVKKFKVTGFLVRPFKAIRLHKAPGALASIFQAINPFSREKKSTEQVRFEGELSTAAWSSSIGWRAGNSGISDPVTHEVGLTALSVSR